MIARRYPLESQARSRTIPSSSPLGEEYPWEDQETVAAIEQLRLPFTSSMVRFGCTLVSFEPNADSLKIFLLFFWSSRNATMIYSVTSPLYRSFLKYTGYDIRK
jgi:hypothetical protein